MAVVKDLITVTDDHALNFGDYTLTQKTKKADFMFEGDLYKIKTYNTITKLEKNGMMVYESVPERLYIILKRRILWYPLKRKE